VIFLDEIESVLGLGFSADELFAAIHHYYQDRALCPAYQRLNFVLLGTSTPRCLCSSDSNLFIQGQAVPLPSFTFCQAQRLADSLRKWFQNPTTIIQRIMHWTNGQPFLTQKLCRLVTAAAQHQAVVKFSPDDRWVDDLVQQQIIDHWEQQDNPEHLRTIRDRLLHNLQLRSDLLALYRNILLAEKSNSCSVRVDHSVLQQTLMMTGLVTHHEGSLQVQNRIYQAVFNLDWCDRQ
jgi:hypothetical protein